MVVKTILTLIFSIGHNIVQIVDCLVCPRSIYIDYALCNTFYNLIFENGLILASVRASSLDPGSCICIAAYTILFPGRTGGFVVGIILIN